MQSSRSSRPQKRASPTQDAFERDRKQAMQIAQDAASGLYSLRQRQRQQNLPHVGLFAVGGTHPPLHPNISTKRKRVDFVDLTSEGDSPREKRPRFSPPKSAPPLRSPSKRKQLANALHKQQQVESKAANEQLARELQAADGRKSKAQRLRGKPNSPEEQPEKKLSIYEEFQKIRQEAAQGEPTQTRKHTLRRGSPEKSAKRASRDSTPEERRASKRVHRTLRSNSPEKQPQKKLSVYEQFQKIEREASQKERPSKKLSVYEKSRNIEREAAQSKLMQTRKHATRSASPEKSPKRSLRGRTPKERKASKQTARVHMDRANSEEPGAPQQQFQVQPRVTASAESFRHMMPPPPPPKNSTGHPMVPSQPFTSQKMFKQTRLQPIDMFAPINPFYVSGPRPSNDNLPSQYINGPRETHFRRSTPFLHSNTLGDPMVPSQPMRGPAISKQIQPRPFSPFTPFNALMVSRTRPLNENLSSREVSDPAKLKEAQFDNVAYRNLSDPAMHEQTKSRSFSPLTAEASRPSNETLLHKTQNTRVTKQSYHTAHKLSYSTQETQRRNQLQGAEVRAQERVRKEQQDKEDYIHKYTRHREALQHGVHIVEVELNEIPHMLCEYFAVTDNRIGRIPSMNPDVAIPSVENFSDFTDEKNGAGASTRFAGANNNSVFRDVGAALGSSNAIDFTNEPLPKRAPSPLFDAPVPHDMFLNEHELPAIVPDESDPITPYVGQPGMFLEPMWDQEEGCWRAPSPGMTQERANVEEMIRSVQYIDSAKLNTVSPIDLPFPNGWR